MHWTTSEIRRFKSLLRATSAPLSFDTLESFSQAVLDPLLGMVEGHGGQLYITDPKIRKKPVFLHHTYDENFTVDYRKRFFKESPLHNILRRGETKRGAFDVASVLDYRRLEKTPFYHEFLKPRDIHFMAGFASRIPGTSTMVMLGVQRRRRQSEFSEEDIELLEMLIPPTLGAVRTLLLANDEREHLAQAFRGMPVGVLVLDWGGRPVYRNPVLEDLLKECPLSESDSDAIRSRAESLKHAYESTEEVPGNESVPLLVGGDRKLLVRVSVLSEGLIDSQRHLLAIFEPRRLRRPEATRRRLRQVHGLTGREAEIAVHCLNGMTNPEIAEELGISRETVKHHLKQVYQKVGIERRSQLASAIG